MQQSRYLTRAEYVSAACREIYSKYGYRRYKMSRFEEYDLYAANRNFLDGDNIITFTSPSGRLMALKPDVTLSIVKNADCAGYSEKVFYTESVYRTVRGSSEFKELMQLGLECIGEVGVYQMGEVIALAVMSLEKISGNYLLDISHMGFIAALADEAGLPDAQRDALIGCIGGRNAAGIRNICSKHRTADNLVDRLVRLTEVYGPYEDTIGELGNLTINEKTDAALDEIRGIYSVLDAFGCAGRVNLDFSHTGDMKYYNGVTFGGYVSGIPFALLSGGRYDSLLDNFGKTGGAIGFAIYLDLLDANTSGSTPGESYNDLTLTCRTDDAQSAVRCARAVRRLVSEGYCVTVACGNSRQGSGRTISLDDIEPETGGSE